MIDEAPPTGTDELRAQLEQLHPSSFGWAMACCRRDRSDAEEVLQNAYLKVLEGKARFGGAASFKTWLFAVIRRTAQDHRRKDLLRGLFMLRAAERRMNEPSAEQPDQRAYHSELHVVFERALARLPSRQREALQLVFYHEMTLQEAAAVMGVSLGSARTHYERGKKRLRELLEASETFYECEVGKINRATVP
jgi:RNA polymerase sigma-70 factor (ECF subfamily)